MNQVASSNGRLSGVGSRKRRVGSKKPARRGVRSRRAKALVEVKRWANRYVVSAVVLSAGLNAWANVDLSGSEYIAGQIAAALIGAVVPGLVWIAGKIAGWSHRAGRQSLAWLSGIAGVCLLLLSIWHCAHALDHLTGSGWLLSMLMAVGIDYGLVASEVAAISAHEDPQ